MECHGYNINPNHQCTMDHLSIIWAHFELQMILCMVKCQTHPQCTGAIRVHVGTCHVPKNVSQSFTILT